eukprot:SAG22_NODE_10182_length_549_cov_0.688889_1_plen_44_part_10
MVLISHRPNSAGLTDMPLEVMNHIGSHLKPHSVVRLGQALKTSI